MLAPFAKSSVSRPARSSSSSSTPVQLRPAPPGGWIDRLERRTFLSVSQASFTDFASTTGLAMHGFGTSPITTRGNRLRLTDGDNHEARSVWTGTAVPIRNFKSGFSFRSNAGASTADGLTFTVQNGPTTALGADGLDLGYTGIGASEAIAFNMFNTGSFGSRFGFASNGERPPTTTDMSPIDMHSGHIIHATVSYDGTTLKVDLTDASDRSKTFSDSKTIDLPAAIGSDAAIVGFTASTGNNISTQEILSWNFSGANVPTVANAATATPNPVTAKSTALSVLGSDSAGESNLTYTWSLDRKPSGARTPTFSANGTNAAKSVNAQFFKAGNYRFRVTIANASGGSTSSDVLVDVQQTATAVRVTPHAQIVSQGDTVRYRASILDQFNRSLRAQPAITFALQEGSGSIDSSSGLFTASRDTAGHVVVSATADELTGTSGATVIA
jgi:hypothetical protein